MTSGLKIIAVSGLALALAFSLSAYSNPRETVTGIAFQQVRVVLAVGSNYALAVEASLGDGNTRDVSRAGAGTVYQSGDPRVALVDREGVVRLADGAVTGETAVVTAVYGGFQSTVDIVVRNLLSATARPGDDGTQLVTNYANLDAVVNKHRNLPAAYVPADLVVPDVRFLSGGEGQEPYLREAAARALEELFTAATADGIDLALVSAYRSYEAQERVFNRNVALYGYEEAARFSARPGQSEHQTGLAMDVSTASVGYRLTEDFGSKPEGKWLAQNAASFGFIIRYPSGAEGVTGYVYEPWHLRYVGRNIAREIHEQGLTLEEYLAG